MLLMLKDIPVLQIQEDYSCKILNYDLLPFTLRYPKVNFLDYAHNWTTTRP